MALLMLLHRSTPRSQTHERRRCWWLGCLALAACTADLPPTKPVPAAEDLHTDAGGGRSDMQSGVMATRGAGMPNVPIHRADAGAQPERDAAPSGAGDNDAQAGMVAAADAAVPMPPSADAAHAVDSDERDAGDAGEQEVALPEPGCRYSFSGVGNNVPDEQGGQHASVQGTAALDGSGAVTFRADGGGVVELPNDVLAGSTSFTALVWLQTHSDACAQRALELSYASSSGNGNGNSGGDERVSLFVTPYGCSDALPMLGYKTNNSTYQLSGLTKLERARTVQLGMSYSARSRTLQLIVNGAVEEAQPVPIDTDQLQQSTIWLGRSHYEEATALAGSITEVRIYASALDAEALRALYERGPDSL
jgi:hypothetical protein